MSVLDLNFAFVLFLFTLLLIAGFGLASGRGVLQFPSIAAFFGIAWVAPQGFELELTYLNPYSTPSFWLYVSGCFIFLTLGFHFARRLAMSGSAEGAEPMRGGYDLDRLQLAAVGVAIVGFGASVMVRSAEAQGLEAQWTGVVTYYHLLSKLSGLSLLIGVLVYLRRPSRMAAAIIVFSILPILYAVLIGFRRELLFDLAILTGGAWMLTRNTHPPRMLMIAVFVLGTVLLNRAGDIRAALSDDDASLASVVLSPELYTEFDYFDLGQRSASEIGQAQFDFWYSNETQDWEYGADQWNNVVHQYVPAFIVGYEIKQSLKVDSLTERLKDGRERGPVSFGSTRTGFSDSYRSFGAFGVLVFAAIGIWFGFLYAGASSGGIFSQFLYLAFLAEGLKSISHSTGSFLAAIPFVLIISLVVFRFARQSDAPSQPDTSTAAAIT